MVVVVKFGGWKYLCEALTDFSVQPWFLLDILLATYDVKYEHFPIVGEALLHTLEQALGDQFTPEVRDSWTAVYGVITEHMSAGMREILEE